MIKDVSKLEKKDKFKAFLEVAGWYECRCVDISELEDFCMKNNMELF